MFVVIAKKFAIKMPFFLFILMWNDKGGALAKQGEHNDPASFDKYSTGRHLNVSKTRQTSTTYVKLK